MTVEQMLERARELRAKASGRALYDASLMVDEAERLEKRAQRWEYLRKAAKED